MQALAELEYPGKLQRLLLTPEREVLVELVITKDNGEIETFNAYRVQHSNSRGPYKGGLRYHPQVDLDDVRRRVAVLQPLIQRIAIHHPCEQMRALSAALPRADHEPCGGASILTVCHTPHCIVDAKAGLGDWCDGLCVDHNEALGGAWHM